MATTQTIKTPIDMRKFYEAEEGGGGISKPDIPEDVRKKIEEKFPEGSHGWNLANQSAAFFGYSLSQQRIRELEKENEDMRSEGKDVIIFCQEQISIAMKEYGKTKDKAIENMYATECMTYGIIVDKLKKLITPITPK